MSDELKRMRDAADATGRAAGVPNAAALIEMLADPKPETARAVSKEEVTGVVRPLLHQLQQRAQERALGAVIYLRPSTADELAQDPCPFRSIVHGALVNEEPQQEVLDFAKRLRADGNECVGGYVFVCSLTGPSVLAETVETVINELS